MNKVRWGMIGTGEVTEKKSGPGLYKSTNSELKGVSSIHMDKTRDYAKRHNIELVFENIDELIESSEIDAIYIATPPSSHKEYAIKAILAGKPVYIEKPMAASYEDCLEIQRLAKEKNIKVFTAFYRRGLEKFNKVKELIEEKTIGDVRCVDVVLQQTIESSGYKKENVPWRFVGSISGGGIFLDMGIHMLDILNYILGEISEIKSFVGNQAELYDVEDIVTATWKFKNGVHGIGRWSFTVFENKDQIEIIGNEGKIIFSCFDETPIKVCKNEYYKEYSYKNPEHVQQPYIQGIVNEILGQGTHAGSLESSISSQRISDDILKSYKKIKNY
ncbi:MAG: Gfo/Idh/MocA family protein [Fusobacteriaceae bacterium]